MNRRQLGSLGAVLLALGVLGLVAGTGLGDHANERIAQLTSRLEALQSELERLAQSAAAGDPGSAQEALRQAEALWEGVQDDVHDLAPDREALLISFFQELSRALEEGDLEDAEALARAARNALDDVLKVVHEYARLGTTVEIESKEVPRGGVVTVAVFVRDVPAGFAGFDIEVRFDPALLRAEEVALATGRGAAHFDNEKGVVRLNGVTLETAAQRVPPDVLPLGTVQFRAVGPSGEETELKTEIVELVDIDGRRVPALDIDGVITIR